MPSVDLPFRILETMLPVDHDDVFYSSINRPARVLSPAAYNRRTGLMLCCPITGRVKGDPFEVRVRSRDI